MSNIRITCFVVLVFCLNLVNSADWDSDDAKMNYNKLKKQVTWIRSTVSSDPIRLSDLPESGLHLRVVNDCDRLLDFMQTDSVEVSVAVDYGIELIQSIQQIKAGGLVIPTETKKRSLIHYNYFSGDL